MPVLIWLFMNEDSEGSVTQMQALREITERSTLRKKSMVMQKYRNSSEITHRHTVNVALNLCFAMIIIPTFILLFPLCFIPSYFSAHQDKAGRTMAGWKGGDMASKASACPETRTASKPGTSRIHSQSQDRNRTYLSDRPRINELRIWRKFIPEENTETTALI